MHPRSFRSLLLPLGFSCLLNCAASSTIDATTGEAAPSPPVSGGAGGDKDASAGAAGASIGAGGTNDAAGHPAGGGQAGSTQAGASGAGATSQGGANNKAGSAGATSQGGAAGSKAGSAGATSQGGAAGSKAGAAGAISGGASGAAGTESGGASGLAGAESGGSSGQAGASASGAAGSAGGEIGGSAGAEAGGSGGSGGGAACPGATQCGAACVDLASDAAHCGSCDAPCAVGMSCQGGVCAGAPCAPGLVRCGAECVDQISSDQHCGGCGVACLAGLFCSGGQCGAACVGGTTRCGVDCVDLGSAQHDCGACDHPCKDSEQCVDGSCKPNCPAGTTLCQGFCTDTDTSSLHCGGCGILCGPGESCVGGVCGPFCDSATTDCDGDGWTVAQGDCCDQPGGCSVDPAKVNPGAVEIMGNGVDDDCNGRTDLADSVALVSCDGTLDSVPSSPTDLARALGICQLTSATPATPAQRTWGLLEAALLRADGSPLGDPRAASIRPSFGQISPATVEGSRIVVLSTGIAADETQTNPGPNGGVPGVQGVSTVHSPPSVVSLSSPGQPRSIHDWFAAENLPLKPAGALPTAPGCVGSQVEAANDSVMLVLRLRAPTNARAFSLRSYFLSAEYPDTVCTTYNDQLVALVRTPNALPSAPNPPDGNLMTYLHGGKAWPVGINIASGTPLFSVCDRKPDKPGKPDCWKNPSVSPDSCSLGAGQLAGTGFEAAGSGCATGGGSYWLTTRGNVAPGEEVEIRIAIWDVSDSSFDSLVLLDGFRWLADPVSPGTIP